MNEITKELLDALKPFAAFFDAVEHMGGNYPKTGAIYSVISHIGGHREITVEDFKQAREIIAKAEATLATPQPSADNPDRACCGTFKGTPHRSTCAKYRGKKPAPQPSDDGWIPWEGGDCPVAHGTVVDVRFRDGWEGDGLASKWRWHHATQENSDVKELDIIAYRVVKS